MQLVIILVATTAIASAVSHLAIYLSKIQTTAGKAWMIGPTNGEQAYLAGSSLSGDGISWDRVSAELNLGIRGWGVPGSSPWEWEAFQEKAPDAKVSFIVVSAYDLNEAFLCDFHANVVPVNSTTRDLWQSKSDWQFSKRVLSQYPLKYIRILFPTAGRSRGLMGELRDKLSSKLGGKADTEPGPTFSMVKNANENFKEERISDWSVGKLIRRVSALRGASQGRQSFDGPKRQAFLRMVRQGQERGRGVVLVLPVSPAYAAEFLSAEARHQFECALEQVKNAAPGSLWIRLDQLPGLSSNDCFWDVVHMNRKGQRIATEALLGELTRSPLRDQQMVAHP